MKIIYAETTLRKYPVYIGRGIMNLAPGLLRKHFSGTEKILFITNTIVNDIYNSNIDDFIGSCSKSVKKIVIKDGEEQKNLENTAIIYENMLDFNMHRDDLVIAFGGGVIGDMAGFAASTFHRGLKLLQMPTTIISQVDSSIGGKVVVNFKNIKNVIGCFYQPHAIIIDTFFLETLDEKDIVNGLAEIVKYGIIFDRSILKLLNSMVLEKTGAGRLNEMISLPKFEEITYGCARIKTSVVKKDEFDVNYRNLLNFGHTAGHAIEQIFGFRRLNHGQAVAIGMIIAIDISISMGLLKDSIRQDIINLYKKLKLPYSIDISENLYREKFTVSAEKQPGQSAGCQEQPSGNSVVKLENNSNDLAADSEINIGLKAIDEKNIKVKLSEEIFNAMKFDKKFSASSNKFILLKGVNKPVFYHNIEANVIKEAIIKNIEVRL